MPTGRCVPEATRHSDTLAERLTPGGEILAESVVHSSTSLACRERHLDPEVEVRGRKGQAYVFELDASFELDARLRRHEIMRAADLHADGAFIPWRCKFLDSRHAFVTPRKPPLNLQEPLICQPVITCYYLLHSESLAGGCISGDFGEPYICQYA